jgi:hypothetical protein
MSTAGNPPVDDVNLSGIVSSPLLPPRIIPLLEQNLSVRPVQNRSSFLNERPQTGLTARETQDASFSLTARQTGATGIEDKDE